MTIKIFQNEINDGIGELVKSTASVAYCSQATTFKGQQFSEKLASAMENTKVAEKILKIADFFFLKGKCTKRLISIFGFTFSAFSGF